MISDNLSLRDYLISLASIHKANEIPKVEDVKDTINFSELDVENLSQVKDLLKILDDKEMLKIFLVFCIKGFTWTNELRNYFNISGDRKEWTNQKISNCVDNLASLGFIINIHYTHIEDDIVQEYISMSMSDNFSNWLNPNGKIYVITKEGLFWGNHIKKYIKNLIFTNRSFFNSYKSVIRVTTAYIDFTNETQEEEDTNYVRRIKSPFENIYIQKKTRFFHKTQQEHLEVKKEFFPAYVKRQEYQGHLTESTKNQLVVLENNQLVAYVDPVVDKYKKTRIPTTTYNGQSINEKHLFDELHARDEEIKSSPTTLNGFTKKDLNKRSKKLPLSVSGKPIKGYYFTPKAYDDLGYEKKTEEQKCEDFLSMLGSKAVKTTH